MRTQSATLFAPYICILRYRSTRFAQIAGISIVLAGWPASGSLFLLQGFDRLVAILCGTNSIRDVIAFPKTGGGLDPLFKSPSNVPDGVLAQYGIRAR